MMIAVMKLDFHDDRVKKKVMTVASSHSGVISVAMDMKEMKLTVTGEIDPVSLVSKLRKHCHVDMVSAGPPPAKKDEPIKPEPNKDEEYLKLMQVWDAHNRSIQIQYQQPYYYVREQDPNACVIC